MKFSNIFLPTTKENLKDATLPSHQYLIRGGFINQVGTGIYNFMPLGKIVLDKIATVVREEMNNTGANELLMSFVTPFKFWEETNRAFDMGAELLKFKDRKGAKFVLSPTNEETVVDLVKNRITSYKDLPINFYQINTKFRDEIRPRFGVMRAREFLMKDAYSFHSCHEDLVREFHVMEKAYKKIYERLSLEFRVVEADSGAIGGSGSKEFIVLANSGEDTIVVCDSCNYGANIEAAVRKVDKKEPLKTQKMQKVFTPNCITIKDVSSFLGVSSSYSIKAVMKKAIYKDSNEIVLFFIRGNEQLEETKACNVAQALQLVDATQEEVREVGLVPGYCGVINLPENIKVFVDKELKDDNNIVCGANEEGYHFTGVNLTSLTLNFVDLIAVQEGDLCSCCGGKLSYIKGIEAGHIFQLGTKYSKAMNANFLDKRGKAQPFFMGSYGIGVSRLMAAIIEQNHDEKGCIWTKASAPFMVDVIVSNGKKDEEFQAALEIYEALKSNEIEAIFDDRKDVRFGFKMGDFELIGFPYAIIVGKKIEHKIVEIVHRKTLQKTEVSIDNVVSRLLELIK